MGLIRAGIGAIGGTLADQWKEYFYCEALDKNTLAVKGIKRTGSRSSNTKGSDNVISNGSGIAVADGQAMIIVEDGKVVEFCAEPGNFTYNTALEPSLFTGKLGDSLKETFKQVGKRFTYGGDTGKDQRVYYFNTKEIIDNKFGTANPIPFRIVDAEIGYRVSLSIRCSGTFSYKITDPLLFYTNVCGNISNEYSKSEIESVLKTEFVAALNPAMGEISKLNLLPEDIITHTTDVEDAMRTALAKTWTEKRGITVSTIALGSVTLPEESQKKLEQAQQSVFYSNPGKSAGFMTQMAGQSMVDAANNTAGAMTGFMGMGMGMNMAGGAMGGLSGMYQQANAYNQQMAQQQPAPQAPQAPAAPAANAWTCACGAQATGKFCPECGAAKPVPQAAEGWTCACGTVNQGKFCSNCGAKKPAGALTYKCDKCGWVPEDPAHPPKFCPECGDIFDDSDANQ